MRGSRWEVVWSHAGLWAFRELPWRDAERVDAAVMRFAATGEGVLAPVRGDPTETRLEAPAAYAPLVLGE